MEKIQPNQGGSAAHGALIAGASPGDYTGQTPGLLATLLDIGSLPAMCLSQSGKIRYANRAVGRLLRYEPEDFRDISILDVAVFLSPQDWAQHWENASPERTVLFTGCCRMGGGELIPTELQLVRGNIDGEEMGAVFFRDLSREREAEVDRSRLLCFTELNPNPIIEVDFAGEIVYLNAAARSLFPSIEEGGFGHPFLTHLRPLVDRLTSREASSTRIEVQVGSSYYEQLVHFVPDIRRLRIFAVDITRQKASQRELQAQSAFFRKVIDTAPYFIFAKDRNCRFTLVNKAVADAYGTTVEDLTGKTDADFNSSAEEVEHFRQDDLEVMNSLRTKYIAEEVITDAAGNQRWLQTVKLPIIDESGHATHVLGASTDITERKRAESERRDLEARVQHSQKLESLGVLAGGIAHDFNNLLMGILGNASLAMTRIPPGTPEYAFISKLKTAAERAAELTNQLLAFSGRGKFVVAPLDLSSAICEMRELLSTAISKKAAVEYQFEPDLPQIQADPSQIRQVVMNLIINASEALGDKHGKISICTGVTDGRDSFDGRVYLEQHAENQKYVYLQVADTGIGMSSEVLDKMFDPFFTTKFTGRGLGLAGVLGVIRSHRGMMRVKSVLGEGTTFQVLFPIGASVGKSDIPEPGPVSQDYRGSGRVLVVDDEPITQAAARDIFEHYGFDVAGAADGEEALKIFKNEHDSFVCILLDLTMPGKDGVEVLTEMRKIDEIVPIILTSGYSEQEAGRLLENMKVNDFIQKPYTPAALMQKVSRLVPNKQEKDEGAN